MSSSLAVFEVADHPAGFAERVLSELVLPALPTPTSRALMRRLSVLGGFSAGRESALRRAVTVHRGGFPQLGGAVSPHSDLFGRKSLGITEREYWSCVPWSLGTWYLTSVASQGRGQSGGRWDLVMWVTAEKRWLCWECQHPLAVDWARTDSEGGTDQVTLKVT